MALYFGSSFNRRLLPLSLHCMHISSCNDTTIHKVLESFHRWPVNTLWSTWQSFQMHSLSSAEWPHNLPCNSSRRRVTNLLANNVVLPYNSIWCPAETQALVTFDPDSETTEAVFFHTKSLLRLLPPPLPPAAQHYTLETCWKISMTP